VHSAVSNHDTHIVPFKRCSGAVPARRIATSNRLEQDVILFVRDGGQADRPRMSFRNRHEDMARKK
jgi:hypothetical protein